jgi:sulfatase modifying factor 1
MNPFSIVRAASPAKFFPLLILFFVQQAQAVDPNTMVLIHSKGQTFSMGQVLGGKVWTQTTPVHDVRFTYDFLVRATELSQGQYMSVNNRSNPSKHKIEGNLNLPVEQVPWNDAIAYCNDLSVKEGLTPVYSASGVADITKNGYRLLTSAENEFITRQRTTTLLSYGDEYSNFGLLFGWSDGSGNRNSATGNSRGMTHDVGTLRPNPYGVYDMVGNVWEWCNDRYDGNSTNDYPSGLQIDQTGPATGGERIAKGGAFWNDGGHHEMSANHWQWNPGSRSEEVGFRICRTVLPSENLEFSNVITAPTRSAAVWGANVSGTVSCSANVHRSGGVGVAGVQFRVDGINIGSEILQSPYSIIWDTTTAVNGSHTLSVVARDDTGILTSEFETVKVSNANPSKLILVNQPKNVKAVAGQPVTFQVDATGSPLPTYQWRRNGDDTNATNYTVFQGEARMLAHEVDITNAVATSYTTPPVTAADNGAVFSVVVTDSTGAITSADATLTIASP